MSRTADSAFPEVADDFDPPLYTNEELEFIRDHLGETSYLALQQAEDEATPLMNTAKMEDAAAMNRQVRVGKGARADRPSAMATFQRNTGNALQRFHQLAETFKHRGEEWRVCNPVSNEEWPGFDGIRTHINRWLRRQELFLERKMADPQKKGFHPEMWKIREGQPVWSGRGTHSERVRYPLSLVPLHRRSYEDFTKEAYGLGAEDNGTGKDLGLTLESIRSDRGLKCPVDGCDYVAEFDPESQMSENRAEQGLKVHMSNPKGKFEPDKHREAKERLFR